MVEDPERFLWTGEIFLKLFLHFLSREKKTKSKKTPVSSLFLRVTKPGEAARIMLSGKASGEARRAAIV